MEDVLVGLLAVAVGALFCFRGYLALRVVFPIWGAFVGFMFGAGLVAGFADEGFLRSVVGWLVAFAFALLFGLLAYFYYAVAVIIGMGAIGFALGTALMAALGVEWSWLVILVGVTVGVVLALISIMGNMPMVLLVVLSSFAGAAMIVAGLLLIFGIVDTGDFTAPAATKDVDLGWWWTATLVVLAVIGMISQIRATERLMAPIRQEWTGAPAASGK